MLGCFYFQFLPKTFWYFKLCVTHNINASRLAIKNGGNTHWRQEVQKRQKNLATVVLNARLQMVVSAIQRVSCVARVQQKIPQAHGHLVVAVEDQTKVPHQPKTALKA